MTKKPNARSYGQDIMRGEGGYMTKRKANAEPSGGGGGAWKELNEKMAKGRASLQGSPSEDAPASGTSIFDPVLCELIYRWFCPPEGAILDPFAGGSVRGIVASHLGRRYTGVELRGEQVAANRQQLDIARDPKPEWIEGDSRTIPKLIPADRAFDLVFSCPPYWNLEVYSEDKRDLSTLGADDFFTAQAAIIKAACSRLRNDRFAAWVVGDVRDSKGLYVNIPGRTTDAFEAAGLRLYNEVILMTAAGSLAMRTGKQFAASRKFGKTHQNVLIYVKGDPVRATKAIGPVEFGDIEEAIAKAVDAPAGLEAFGEPL